MDIKTILTDGTLYKMPLPFKFIHKFIIDAMGFSKEEDCYGVWYHGVTQNSNEPSELLAVFSTEIKAQEYINCIGIYKKGYCFIVKSKYYK